MRGGKMTGMQSTLRRLGATDTTLLWSRLLPTGSTRAWFCLGIVISFLSFHLPAQSITQSLNTNWVFSELDSNRWLQASVPGSVHTDLIANGILKDPFLGENESEAQWVEKRAWEYECVFDCDKKLWKQKHKELEFEGLDTYADVFLNDSLLFTSENMFVAYAKDVSRLLKKKKNKLRIVFHPASELIEKNKELSAVKNLPGGERVYIRKSQYQFGWDWSPRLVTSGIWKNITLRGYNAFFIRDASVRTISISPDSAVMELSLLIQGEIKDPYTIRLWHGEQVYAQYTLTPRNNAGSTFATYRFSISNPRLWWCNGLGKPELYYADVLLFAGKKSDKKKVIFGIRTIELQTIDARGHATFRFVLNDRPVFAKGANWVPCDNFLARVPNSKYYSLLHQAQESNMNMLRVWGGGAYEQDIFYSLCDSLGIMVWQDFMFACGMYPGNLHFANQAKLEATDQLARLASHPCIALWCGNNENMEGWMNWDWQKEYSSAQQKDIIGEYNALFTPAEGIFPRVAAIQNGNTFPYWPSSPSTGWGRSEAYMKGDVHYWGVWWGMEPFSAYETHVGKFVSEFGFQGMPDERTFTEFSGKNFLTWEDSVVWKHQKHPRGFQTIRAYMERDYPVPENFSDFIYMSQVIQRDGISKAIMAQRRAMPYCMGSLFWQYNDCWPGTSWSSIDYYGRPKLLNYALKDLYKPVALSAVELHDTVYLVLINDGLVPADYIVNGTIMSFDGMLSRSFMVNYNEVLPGRSEVIGVYAIDDLVDSAYSRSNTFLYFSMYSGKWDRSETRFYFDSPKNLALAQPEFAWITNSIAPGEFSLTIDAASFLKSIYLTLDDQDATFSDNGFDLNPAEKKVVVIKTHKTLEELNKNLRIRTLNQFVN
jgi:beta-mannosidase